MKTLMHPSLTEFITTTRASNPLFNGDLYAMVSEIMEDISRRGDAALRHYSKIFDGFDGSFAIDVSTLDVSFLGVTASLVDAILKAKENIEKFHREQLPAGFSIETQSGVLCVERFTPIERVGIYVPGGTAPLISTVLMLAIPAKIAGCKEIVMVTPPSKQNQINPAVLYAAVLCGVTEIYCLGGVQAIGALSLGTESIRKVDKIFGPGNAYVTMAKQWASARGIAIDLPAGPSEVAIIADNTACPEFLAADLLSQAEHSVDAQTLLLTTDEALIEKVRNALYQFMQTLKRRQIIQKALSNMTFVVLDSLEDCITYVNYYAPEHLIINCRNVWDYADKVVNAGSIFIGEFTPESVGDYASGTNHTLPTSGMARTYGALGVTDFMKRVQIQSLSYTGLLNIAETVSCLAEAEGLDAHKLAVEVRLSKPQNNS